MASTKERIANAYLMLLRDAPDEHVPVKQIVRAAGVTRNTFYYHFSCVEELRHYAVDDFVEGYRNITPFDRRLLQSMGTGHLVERSAEVFSYVYDHRETFTALMSTSLREETIGKMLALISDVSAEFPDGYLKEMPEDSRRLYNYSLGWTVLGCLDWWAVEGFTKTPQELAIMLIESVFPGR